MAFASLLCDGVIGGVGTILAFLPLIAVLYFGIALLESSGYMARIAFLLHGFFHKFGLHGKSFIPLVAGFGCSVPAYMATRTLKNRNERLITLFVIGFMSCSARLPIYVLFIGAFFDQKHAGLCAFWDLSFWRDHCTTTCQAAKALDIYRARRAICNGNAKVSNAQLACGVV